MYRSSSVGVVIPAHNEEQFVADVIETVPEFVDRVFVVDDCSTDDTWSEITDSVGSATDVAVTAGEEQIPVTDGSGSSVSAFDHRVVPVRHERNRGRGAAVKTGYRMAMKDDIDVVAVMDADGQMNPDELDRLVDPIVAGDADYTKGNRLAGPTHWGEMSGFRLFGNLLLTLLTRVASGYWDLRDPQNGYTAISRSALEALSIPDLYDRYGFLNDVLIRLAVHDLRVVGVPMQAIYGEETSGIRYSSFMPKLSFLLLTGFCRRLWMTYMSTLVRDR